MDAEQRKIDTEAAMGNKATDAEVFASIWGLCGESLAAKTQLLNELKRSRTRYRIVTDPVHYAILDKRLKRMVAHRTRSTGLVSDHVKVAHSILKRVMQPGNAAFSDGTRSNPSNAGPFAGATLPAQRTEGRPGPVYNHPTFAPNPTFVNRTHQRAGTFAGAMWDYDGPVTSGVVEGSLTVQQSSGGNPGNAANPTIDSLKGTVWTRSIAGAHGFPEGELVAESIDIPVFPTQFRPYDRDALRRLDPQRVMAQGHPDDVVWNQVQKLERDARALMWHQQELTRRMARDAAPTAIGRKRENEDEETSQELRKKIWDLTVEFSQQEGLLLELWGMYKWFYLKRSQTPDKYQIREETGKSHQKAEWLRLLATDERDRIMPFLKDKRRSWTTHTDAQRFSRMQELHDQYYLWPEKAWDRLARWNRTPI